MELATVIRKVSKGALLSEVLPNLDFNKIINEVVTRQVESESFAGRCSLAASLGTLTSESMKAMDDYLKVAIVGTLNSLAKLKEKDELTWGKVVSCMMQNPLLERTTDNLVHRSDKLIKKSNNWFKFDGGPSITVIREVQTWIKNLIRDDDVIQDMQLDENSVANIVACTGASVTSFVTFFAKDEYHEKKIVDVGVLRYPDIQHPYFKVYRIQLTAWSDCSRVLFYQHDSNGITGEFNSMNFKPRDEVISNLKKDTLEKAVAEAEMLF